MFNNVTKVAGNNFGLVWRMMLYKFIAFLICAGLFVVTVVPIVNPVLNEISDTKFFPSLMDVVREVLSGGYFTDSFKGSLEVLREEFSNVGVILTDHAVNMAFGYIVAALIFVILRFLLNFTDFAVAYAVNENMSSNAKLGFAATVTKTLKQALRYRLAFTLLTLPFDIIIGVILVAMIYYLLPVMSVFIMFFVILTATFLIALRMSLFSFWMPEIINNGGTIFGSLKKSVSLTFQNFWKHLGGYAVLTISIIALSIFLIAYTFGAGLILLMPLSSLLIISYVFVSYYISTRRSYYVNYDMIAYPPPDFDAEAKNYTIPEDEVRARMEELKKEREEIEKQDE